jgi:hypothetical protein
MRIELDTQALLPQAKIEPKEMLSWTTAQDGRRHFRINFSSLSIMQECWRKTELSLIRKLRSSMESPATLFGSAIHKGLETFYRGDRKERVLPKNYKETMEMIGCGHWEEDWSENLLLRAAHSFVKKAEPLSALPDENKRSLHTGVWILRHYFDKYLTDEYVVACDEAGPIVERTFTMRIWEDDKAIVDTFGTIDAVMRNEVNGLVLPADHKTTSHLGDFYDKANPNFQYTLYLWAAQKILGFETDSFLINALQVKAMPKTSRGTPPDFARQVTTRTQADFDELLYAILGAIGSFMQFEQVGRFPMSAPGPCSNFGGCQYREICGAPAQLRENIISARYKQAGVQ